MFYKKYLLTGLLCASMIKNGMAQGEKLSHRLSFHSINNIGLLNGTSGHAFQMETINGMQYGKWFGGLGIGIDEYRFRTIPLFIDLRKEMGKSIHRWFLFADAGLSVYWKKDSDVRTFPKDSQVKNGFSAAAGAGYSIKLNRQLNLLLSGGYSYKAMDEEGRNLDPRMFIPLPGGIWIDRVAEYGPLTSTRHSFRRWVLKVGITF